MTKTLPIAALSRRSLLRAFGFGAALTVAACGKRGPLEPPPESDEGRKLSAARASQSAEQPGVPSIKGTRRRPPPIKPPKDDFFLDALL